MVVQFTIDVWWFSLQMIYSGSVYRGCMMIQFTDDVWWFSLQMVYNGSVYR